VVRCVVHSQSLKVYQSNDFLTTKVPTIKRRSNNACTFAYSSQGRTANNATGGHSYMNEQLRLCKQSPNHIFFHPLLFLPSSLVNISPYLSFNPSQHHLPSVFYPFLQSYHISPFCLSTSLPSYSQTDSATRNTLQVVFMHCFCSYTVCVSSI